MHRTLPRSLLAVLATTAVAHAEPLPERDPHFVDAIRKAAAGYTKWGRVDERPNLAPSLCRAPLPQDYGSPSHVRLSQADDGPHADKLYYLWASARDTYRQLAADKPPALPVGFTVVKQSFSVKELAAQPAAEHVDPHAMAAPPPISWLEHDGKVLATDRPKDLFVMTKVADGAASGTDDGWIYGTITPDGSVTSAGRVGRCMHCHVEAATHERLFGPR